MMFAPYCSYHASRVLLPNSAITALVRSEEGGLIAHFVCHCGQSGVWKARDAANLLDCA